MTSSPLAFVLAPILLAAAVLTWPTAIHVRARSVRASRLRSAGGDGRPSRPSWVGRLALVGLRRGRVRAARATMALPADLVMELVACGLRAGLSLEDALAAGSGASERAGSSERAGDAPTGAGLAAVVAQLQMGVRAEIAWRATSPEFEPLARAMLLAQLSGAPAADVVARAAVDSREARRRRAELAAARLGVRLVLPLGLAVLPGFVLLSVVPIVLGLATSVLAVHP